MSSQAAGSLRVEGLSHRYPGGERLALDDVDMVVTPGQRLGLLGPNGAGKSTLMRLVCGFLPIRSGPQTRVEVAGFDLRTQSRQARRRVGYLPEHVPLYHELRAREHLAFRARIKGIAGRRRQAEIERVAELTDIRSVLDTPIGQLSRGYRQRVGLSDALLGAPPVVILDEPTVGLDPNQVREIRAMLRRLGGEHTLVFSSHILAEVELLCDRVVILAQGRVVVDEALTRALTAQHVIVGWQAEPAQAQAVVDAAWRGLGWDDVPSVACLSTASAAVGDGQQAQAVVRGRLDLPTEASVPVDAVLAALGDATRDAGLTLVELRAGTTRLEERFAEVTGARRQEAEAVDEAKGDDV